MANGKTKKSPTLKLATSNDREAATKATPPDPFADIDALRLDQDFEEQAGARTLLTTVPVRKPNRQEWIHIHPDENYRGKFAIYTIKEERETYLVVPHVAKQVKSEIVKCIIYVWQNASGVTGLWPIPVQGPTDKPNAWHTSAHEAALRGMTERIRVSSNMTLGAYEVTVSDNPTAAEHEPKWPSETLVQLLAIGFKGGRLIDSPDHVVLKKLRGE
jgi:hypothetical protein